MKKLLILLILFAGTVTTSAAENKSKIDSLQNLLKTAKQDSNKANILYELSREYDENDVSVDYAEQCLALSEQIGFKKGMGNAYNVMGVVQKNNSDYAAALDFYNKALDIRKEIGDKNGVCISYNNIGVIFTDMANYPQALKNLYFSLKLSEEINDKELIAQACINIGNIYLRQKSYTEALKYYNAALTKYKEMGDKNGISFYLGNIGIIYNEQGNYAEALKSYKAALEIYEEMGAKSGISKVMDHIGRLYYIQHNYSEALRYVLNSIKIQEEIEDKRGLTFSYLLMGNIYFDQKKYSEASQYLNKSLSISKEIGNLEIIMDSFDFLSALDSARGNYKQALENYKNYIAVRDSIYNKENTKKLVQSQMQYDFDKKETIAKAEQEKKDIRQRNIRNSIAGVLAGAILILIVALYQRNKISREKKKSDSLLLNILPSEVATELKTTGISKTKSYTMVTVMFTDFKDFTRISERVSAELLVDEIHYCFSAFDNIISKYRIEKIKTIGDSYLCASGLPVYNYTHAEDMVRAAFEIRDFIANRKKEKESIGEIPFELRIGIHTGPLVAGIVGVKKYAYDIWGDTVNIAARMEQNSEAGMINISGSTYELVKDKFTLEYRGKIEAKNKGMVDMYFVRE